MSFGVSLRARLVLIALSVTVVTGSSPSYGFTFKCPARLKTLFRKPKVEAPPEVFETPNILAAIAAKGLDPELLKAEFKEGFGNSVGALKISYGNEGVLVLGFESYSRERRAISSTGLINPVGLRQYSGTGIGTLGYLISAQTLYDRYSMILSSDGLFPNISQDAMNLWERLVANGYAERTLCEYGPCFQFREAALKQKIFSPLVTTLIR